MGRGMGRGRCIEECECSSGACYRACRRSCSCTRWSCDSGWFSSFVIVVLTVGSVSVL